MLGATEFPGFPMTVRTGKRHLFCISRCVFASFMGELQPRKANVLLFSARHCLAGATLQSPQQIPKNYSQFKRMTQHKSVSQARGKQEEGDLRSLWALHSNLSQSINCQRKYQLSTSNKKPDAKVNAADAYPSDTRYKILRSLSAALAFISTHDHFKGPRRKRVSETEVIAFTPLTPPPCLLCLHSFLPLSECWLSGANCGCDCGCDCGTFDRICQIHSVERVPSCVSACGAGMPGQGPAGVSAQG